MVFRLSGTLWLLCASALSAQRPTTIPSPQPATLSPQDVARGKQLFEAQCAPCHGITGTGGAGANLARPTLKHAGNDVALFSVIQNGIENSGMPAAWQMTDRETWLVVAHVRSLGRTAVERLPGDPARGRSIYAAQSCGGCHMVNGIGGTLGTDLAEVGARRSAERLRQTLLQPGSALPEGFLMVRVVAGDGSVVEGIRANEDSFSIQVRDLSNKFHSFRKQQLRELQYRQEATPMPSYRDKLSSNELEDLVAYLASLRGKS